MSLVKSIMLLFCFALTLGSQAQNDFPPDIPYPGKDAPDPEPEVLETVDYRPHFPACRADTEEARTRCHESQVRAYLNKHLRFPAELVDTAVNGLVVVQYVVSAQGKVEQVKILKSLHPLMDAESLRVVSSLPKHVPGRHQNQAVAVRFTVPIRWTQH